MVNQFLVELLIDCLVSWLVRSLCRLGPRMSFSVVQFEVRNVGLVLVLLLSLFRDVCEKAGSVI